MVLLLSFVKFRICPLADILRVPGKIDISFCRSRTPSEGKKQTNEKQ